MAPTEKKTSEPVLADRIVGTLNRLFATVLGDTVLGMYGTRNRIGSGERTLGTP